MSEFQQIPESEINYSQKPVPVLEPEVSEPEVEAINNIEEVDEERKRQLALTALFERGYIDYSEDGQIIADIDKIDNYSSRVVVGNSLPEALRRIYGTVTFSLFQDIFRDKPVISRQDWEQGKSEPKPLFYDPVSDEAALDPTTIKTSNFYLTPFKINRKYGYQKLEKVSELEANLALYIYHPRFGNGYRDKTGQLMVTSINGVFRPIDGEYFAKNFGYHPQNDSRKGGGFMGSPTRFLEEYGQNLVETEALKLDDFKRFNRAGDPFPDKIEKNAGDKGFIFIDGIQYFVGKKQGGMKFRVVGSNCAVMLKGVGEIPVAYFRLRPDLRIEGRQITNLTQEQTNLQEYKEATFSEKWPDESDEEYKARMEGLLDLELNPIKIGDLSAQTKEQMKEINSLNWSKLENPVLAQKVIEDFNTFLDTDKTSRFVVDRLNEKRINGFFRISPMSNPDRVYIGALNNNQYSHVKIGAKTFGGIITEIAKTRVVENTAYPKLPVIRTYMKEFGCVIKAVELYPGTDIPMFRMELDRRKNNDYKFLKDEPGNDPFYYFHDNNYSPDDDIIVLRYRQETEYEAMINETNHILSRGQHVMTSYQNKPGEVGYKYLVFEKIPSPKGNAEVEA